METGPSGLAVPAAASTASIRVPYASGLDLRLVRKERHTEEQLSEDASTTPLRVRSDRTLRTGLLALLLGARSY